MLKKLSVLLVLLCLLPIKVLAEEKPVVTVTTSFLQDMVTQLAGDEVTIDLLIPAGQDPHVYQPKAQDLQKITQADLVLYHGLHFEGKMVDILEPIGIAVAHSFDETSLIQVDEEGESVVDPHFWFDIELYKEAVENAADALKEAFPTISDTVEQNKISYLSELDELSSWVEEQLAQLPVEQRQLVTPHDAFNYFARAYEFEVLAPQGINTNSEVSNNDIAELVDLIVERQIPAIFVESTTNPERMEKVKEAVEAKGGTVTVVSGDDNALFSDSLAPVGASGDTYIEMYQHNVSIIVSHLVQ